MPKVELLSALWMKILIKVHNLTLKKDKNTIA